MKKPKLGDQQRVLGTKNPKPVRIPNSDAIPRLNYGENIIEMKRTKTWVSYFGYGIVRKIFKNDDFDLAYIDFGRGENYCSRVYFKTLNSRKQMTTLKVGQYGMFSLLRKYSAAKDNINVYVVAWAMGVYVPKIVDIRNSELTQEELEEMSNEDYSVGVNILDQFKKND